MDRWFSKWIPHHTKTYLVDGPPEVLSTCVKCGHVCVAIQLFWTLVCHDCYIQDRADMQARDPMTPGEGD